MFAFIVRRLLATIPVMLVVAVFVFLMLRLTPSDPAAVTERLAREFRAQVAATARAEPVSPMASATSL